MKILITGAYGQLGSELKKLATGLNNLECYFTDFDTLDITDFDTLSTFFDVNSPDFVINCAAYTAVDLAEKELEKATLLNSIAPGILASLCEKNSAKFIHISTDYVFDGMAYTPYTEENSNQSTKCIWKNQKRRRIECDV
jgi:dTDP-4-dehydrorhamnose reductase